MPTIALVDDDRNILTSVSIALEAEGYRIMTYTDGASALDGFRTSPPDPAILDIKMPRMDGMETLRRLAEIRSAGNFSHLQGRGNRRVVRAQDGRRRFYPQAVFAAPAGRAREGGTATRSAERSHRGAEGNRCQGAGPRTFAYGSRASHLHLEERTGDADGDGISDPAGAGHPSRRREKPQRPDGCGL